MKKAKLAASLIAVSMAATTLLTGCNNNPSDSNTNSNPTNSNTGTNSGDTNSTPPEDTAKELVPGTDYKENTVLRMAAGYNSAKTGIAFDPETAGSGITLANGKTYNSGDLKPTWETAQERLKIKFENKYQGKKDSDEWAYWKDQLDQVDIVSGTASDLSKAGTAGLVVNLNEYIDRMPNFKKYLEDNPIVRLSVLGDTDEGGIYFSPYFDGVDDIERMPLMRTDWVEKLLNGTDAFAASKSGTTATPVYQAYMPTSGKHDIDVVKADGSGTEKITKDYDAAGGNIIDIMNAKGQMSGVEAVNTLRDYIDKAYGGYYTPDKRADLFIGQNAAWDADELVALLRCVVANAQTLNGTDSIQGLFSRNDDKTSRRVDMFRLAGTLFGARGLESRQDYLYVGNDNKLHDGRQEEATYKALQYMNNMAKEGLISKSFMEKSAESSETMLANDLGFMHYDYNQTQTLYNQSKLQEGEQYRAVMVPVARWNDGSGEQLMRFTESWRSVKSGGWGISKAGVGSDENKLNAALKLVDYAYSMEGRILMSYGPDEFIKKDASGNFEYFDFNGEKWPKIADETRDELWSKANGNYTNYARMYLGSTLSFLKSQSFEYECTQEAGKIGAGYISKAIAFGTIKHPLLELASNPWYTSVPTVLPTTDTENTQLAGFTELSAAGYFGSGDKESSILIDIIVNGFTGDAGADPAAMAKKVSDDWNGTQYLFIKNKAWDRLLEYYNG